MHHFILVSSCAIFPHTMANIIFFKYTYRLGVVDGEGGYIYKYMIYDCYIKIIQITFKLTGNSDKFMNAP